MDQDSKAPQEKHAGGLRRTAINVLVPLVVFLVPVVLYLLYISKQDQYFRTYYQRELGTIAREMGGRLDFLRRPMSQWLSGVDESTFRETAPRWLARFKCNNCQPFEFSVRISGISNNIIESILPNTKESERLLEKLQKIGLEPKRYDRLEALVRRLLELNRNEIGPHPPLFEIGSRLKQRLNQKLIGGIHEADQPFSKGTWDLIAGSAKAILRPSDPKIFKIDADSQSISKIKGYKKREIVNQLARDLANAMAQEATAAIENSRTGIDFDALGEMRRELEKINTGLIKEGTLFFSSNGRDPRSNETEFFIDATRKTVNQSITLLKLLSANYNDFQESIRLVVNQLIPKLDANQSSNKGGVDLELAIPKTKGSTKGEAAIPIEGLTYEAEIPIEDLIPYQSGQSIFQNILITDENGRVFYQDKDGFPQLLRLIPKVGGYLFTPGRAQQAQSRNQETGTGLASILSDFLIHAGGADQQIFCQPLGSGFSLASGNSPTNDVAPLLLCGLVEAKVFSSHVKAVSPNKIVIAIGALALAILLTPFLKLWLIRPDEPYRLVDQFALRVALYLLVAIGTIAFLDGSRYHSLNARLNESLETIANSLVFHFENELDEAVMTLQQFEKHLSFKRRSHKGWADAFTRRYVTDGGDFPTYPPFEAIGVVAYDGFTLSPFDITTRDREISGGKVSHRDYFKRAKYGPLWKRGVCEALEKGCFVQRIFSMNEGVRMSAITTLSRHDWLRSNKPAEMELKPRINALFKRFQAFMSPPLPLGFQFAVVRSADGKVLFHSNDRLSKVENFYDEIARDADLVAAIHNTPPNGSIQILPGDYHGIEHTFAVAPLATKEWTLVVLRDMRLVQTVNAEAALASLFGVLVFLNVLVLMTWSAKALYEHPPGGWIWPNIKSPQRYFPVFAALIIVAATEVGIILLNKSQPVATFLLFTLLSALILATVLGLLTPERKFEKRRLKNALPAALGIAVMIAVAAAPIIGCLSSSHALIILSVYLAFLLFYGVFVSSDKARRSLAVPKEWARTMHPWFALLLFIVLAALPAWAGFETAWRINIDALLRANVVGVSYAIDGWETALRKDARRIRKDSAIQCLPFDLIPSSGLVRVDRNFDAIGENRGANCKTEGSRQQESEAEDRSQAAFTASNDLIADFPPKQTMVAQMIKKLLPKVSGDSAMLRSYYAASGDAAGKPSHNWHWRADQDFTLVGNPEIEDATFRDTTLVGLTERLPTSAVRWWTLETPRDRIFSAIVLLVSLSLFWLVLRKIANRIFAFDSLLPAERFVLPTFKGFDEEQKEREWWIDDGVHRMIIHPGFDVADKLSAIKNGRVIKVIDLSNDSKITISDSDLHRTLFVLENFESDLYDAETKYDVLQQLLDAKGSLIYIVSDIDITRCLEGYLRRTIADPTKLREKITKWTRLFERFQKVYGKIVAKDWRDEGESEAQAILTRECGWSNSLEAVEKDIAHHPEFSRWREKDIVSIVSDKAEVCFSELWRGLNNDEKRMLYQLARGNHFNPGKTSTMQCLIGRGFVVADPDYKIPGESFRRFVLHAESDKQIRQWEHHAYGGLWPILRVPLVALLVAAGAILFFLQPQTFQALTAFLAAMAAGLPILLRLFAATPSGEK